MIKSKKLDWDAYFKAGHHLEKVKPSAVFKFSHLIKSGSRVLDYGCGSGRNSFVLASKGFKVYGVDTSKEAIKKAKEKTRKIKFFVIRGYKTPFKKEFFDAVYSEAVVEFVDLRKFRDEIYRVVKKNGIVYLTESYYTILKNKKWRNFSKTKLLKIFKNGFRILKTEQYYVKNHPSDVVLKEKHDHIVFDLVLIKK